MHPAMNSSNQFLEALQSGKIDLRKERVLVIDAFGDGFAPGIEHTGQLGYRNVARCIFEQYPDREHESR
jgi:hypothetical protein